MNDSIKKKVFMFAGQVADEQGVEIFDIELLGKGKLLLRVRIDREGGVTLDDCERFSKSFWGSARCRRHFSRIDITLRFLLLESTDL